MRLDLYQTETEIIAREQTALLDEARERILAGQVLSRLEINGILHAIQVLVENAIGKAKHLLKSLAEPVPVSAYDAFASLVHKTRLASNQLPQWNAAIGLRNRIVHDYMNIDLDQVLQLVSAGQYQFVTDFLLATAVWDAASTEKLP